MIIRIWMILAFVIFWIICGVLTYGYNHGFIYFYIKRRYDLFSPGIANSIINSRKYDGILLGMFGPIGLTVTFMAEKHKYGLKFK